MTEKTEYRMTVDLNVLDHLGINLYSNMAAVLTEAVANAWDADAKKVCIDIDEDSKIIDIKDDGVGMTAEDINDRYLRVGYRRREDAECKCITNKGRQVMGRKGLGKLSLFSLADTIEIHTVKNDQRHGLRMQVKGIKQSVRENQSCYSPESLSEQEIMKIPAGTMIRLKDVKRKRFGFGITALKKRLARRFSIIGEACDFQVWVNEKQITTADREDLAVVQFLWYFGDKPEMPSPNELEKYEALDNRLEDWEEDESIKGWIGTARKPKQLDSSGDENLNGIVVLSRGRLFQENILDKLNDGRIYTKYLTGQIEADFLDTDDDPDIATSDRQRIQENDPRYIKLIQFLKKQLPNVESHWSEWRRDSETKKIRKSIPALDKWLKDMPGGLRKHAENVIAKLSSLPIEKEEDRNLMYKHGILAFERMKLHDSTAELAEGILEVDKLLQVLSGIDALEASLYRDIVSGRLDVIKEFRKIVDKNTKERVLQEYLFNHLWLLDPAWERATGSEFMEKRLTERKVLGNDRSQSEKNRLKRVDIAYRTAAGKHIIIEIKRVNRKVHIEDLMKQGHGYVEILKKILSNQNEKNPNIEVVFVIGKPIDEKNPQTVKAAMDYVSPGSRIVHYDELIQNANKAYSEYLNKNKELDRVQSIIDEMENRSIDD